MKDKNEFLRDLSFLVYNHKGSDSFTLDSIIKNRILLSKYQSDIDNLIANYDFFLAYSEKKGYYKKTYRIPEICNRTLSDLRKENIHPIVINMLEQNPLILHTELERWIKSGYKNMPSLILDKYWHTFIIYTLEYNSWCFDNFSRFIHHVPTPQYEKDEFLALDSIKIDSKKANSIQENGEFSSLDFKNAKDLAMDSKNKKAEYFIRENALFFTKYTDKFPITQNILIYNFPYKLLAQNLDFPTIANIIQDIAKI